MFHQSLHSFSRIYNVQQAVTHSGRLGDRYSGLGAQSLAPKKHFLSFLLTVVFQLKIR